MGKVELSKCRRIAGRGGEPGGGRRVRKVDVPLSPLSPALGLFDDVADVNDDGVGFFQPTSIRRRLAVAHGTPGVDERLRPQTESVIGFVVKRSPKQNHFPAALVMRVTTTMKINRTTEISHIVNFGPVSTDDNNRRLFR